MEFVLIVAIGLIALFGVRLRYTSKPTPVNRNLQVILIIVIMLIFGAGVYLNLDAPSQNTDQNEEVLQAETEAGLIKTEALELNQTSTYPLNAGDRLVLTYEGELGQVVTLTIIPEEGASPTVRLSSQIADNPPVPDGSIQARGNRTVVCGYQFDHNATYMFTFQATEFTDYRVEFVAGNTCRNE